MDAAATSSAVAKQLASCNRAARGRAVRLLRSFLSAAVSDEDLLKIWKGLFYCMWHADKLPFQSELANNLASLLLSLESSVSARYLETFFVTIRREWSGIDHLRMDKFYLLIRRFVHHVFLLLSRNGWDGDLSHRFTGILAERSLLSVDRCQAQGVNYQIADIFLDEVMAFLPVAPEVVGKFLKPFVSVLEVSSDKVLNNKIKRNLFGRLLENGRSFLDHLRRREEDGGELAAEVEKLGKVALGLQLSGQFFESASSNKTIQGNRKMLFSLHECFAKLEKDLESSGINVVFLPENGCSEDAVASVIPSGGAESISSKKRKKNKKESASGGKKSKPRKNASSSCSSANGNLPAEGNGENPRLKNEDDAELVSFDEKFMSNLQRQFEKVAAESGLATSGSEAASTPSPAGKTRKKKCKSADAGLSNGDRSVKRVRFSLKNNLIWKPHSPLPPQSLRLPPSATPRGSALKKGVPPGPVKETTPPTVRKGKAKAKASSVKKARKSAKSISPAVKRLRKLQSLSI